ncbi:acyltransferase [Sphingomonas sp. Y38-1Y]|uniref:acyltransferase family protein n=1 Tax=Sphingomonas sp. Y38-1Y TaxID=3078265 RepID=UPI0028E19F6F|nr:acyltransferase [Sphingomonas sp. Y38-1Y]
MSKPGELRALTSARGIAAWLVVFYHIRESLPPVPAPVMAVLDHGYLAVDFFFVLSGFVIALAWRDRVRASGWAAVPGFLRRRFARVWPLHAVVLTGGVVLALLLWATGRHDETEFPFAELPLHFLLIQNWGFTSALAWNDPAWSISAEFAAYLVFPAIVLAIPARRLPSVALIGAIAALIAALAGYFALSGTTDLGHDIARHGVIRCLAGFSIGMLVHALWSRRLSGAAPIAIAVATAATIAWSIGWLPQTAAIPTVFASLLLALATTDPRSLGHPILHRLGEWSYATYLAHFLMWKAFKLAFVSAGGPVPWPLIALYAAMVLAASAFLYRFVEMPAQAWINRRRVAGAPSGTPALR